MEQSIKTKLLDCMSKVYELANKCKLETDFFETVQEELNVLSEYFGTSNSQSFLVAMVFSLNYKGDSVDFNDLCEYFDSNPMKLLRFSDDFESLHAKGIFVKTISMHRMNLSLSNDQFTVNEKVSEAILHNCPLPQLMEDAPKDIIELLDKIYMLGRQRDEDEISSKMFFAKVQALISNHLHFPLLKKIDDFNLCVDDSFLFLYLVWKIMSGQDVVSLDRTVGHMFENSAQQIKYAQSILQSENDLICLNLIETVESDFYNNAGIRLTDTACKLLTELGLKLWLKQKIKRNNIIEPARIVEKELFFSDAETEQINMLKNLLVDGHFRDAQHRLEQKGLPKGITALLHGAPGTGKTETVFQLARITNREIVKVDISQSKSMWFGESEKIIKKIFTNYKAYANECEFKPILLFNEADAIIGRRNEVGNSSVDQTENTIQNILLEELENFDGIFLATTNLVKNIDMAFERRFLFKVEFNKPDLGIKAKIWSSKLPGLTVTECEMLAQRFDFSGGQIDNIVRKNEIYEIIHGVAVSFDNIVDFCNSELLVKNNTFRVGFTHQ